MIAEIQPRKWDKEDFCDKLYPHSLHLPNSKSLNRKPLKRTQKNCDRMLKCRSPQCMASRRGDRSKQLSSI